MPDITMCTGTDCPLAGFCHRATATPSEYRQSYFDVVPFDELSDDCIHFWGNEKFEEQLIKNQQL